MSARVPRGVGLVWGPEPAFRLVHLGVDRVTGDFYSPAADHKWREKRSWGRETGSDGPRSAGQRHGRPAGAAGAHRRTRSFRGSFLLSFARRIGERLREATESAVDEACEEHGGRLLPVLVAQETSVQAALHKAFPSLRRSGSITVDPAGWAAGRLAADMATLGPLGSPAVR